MNTIKEHQKAIKTEKIEKIKNAIDYLLIHFGYFVITTREKNIIQGVNYEIKDNVKDPFILLFDKNNLIYAHIKVKSIIYISPLDFSFK
jgi:hypothetical protein